jgi:HK97 family phage prohead protease
MPVRSCGDGTYRIGDGPCKYTSRESAVRAYVAYLAQEDDDEDSGNKDEKTMIYGYKSFGQSIKDVDVKKGIVTGYFSAFNIKDSDGDIIRPGSFKRSIDEWFPKGRIKHLMNHDPSKPLGVLQVLKEDEYGLYYESKVGTHNLGQDFIKMVESDLVKEHSIGFSVIREQKGQDGNEMFDLKLFEGSSLTAWGANEFTPLLGMKSTKDIKDRIKTFEKFVRNSNATDDAIEMCLLEIKQLYQVVETMSSKETVDETPLEQKSDSDLIDAINLISLKHF